MGHIASTLVTEKSLPSPHRDDFGVREERFRVEMERKVRDLKRQMIQHAGQRYAIGDRAKYQMMLLQISKKINE
jgi:hypothetical protein